MRCRSTSSGGEAAGQAGQLGDVDAADGDRLAVPHVVRLGPLDRVRQRVAVVEHLAAGVPVGAAGLLEVADDHVDLDPDRPLDQLAQRPASPASSVVGIGGLDQVEDRGVGDEAALDDLAQAGDEVGPRQGAQQVEVAQHAGGLVEGADQVLAGARC